MSKYSLYVGITKNNIPSTAYSFHNREYGYYLAYSEYCPKNFLRVNSEIMGELTSDEMTWLAAVYRDINGKHVKKHGDEYIPLLNAFLDEVEKELKREARKRRGLGVKSNEHTEKKDGRNEKNSTSGQTQS